MEKWDSWSNRPSRFASPPVLNDSFVTSRSLQKSALSINDMPQITSPPPESGAGLKKSTSPFWKELIERFCLQDDLSTYDPYDIWKTPAGLKVKKLYNAHRGAGLI